MSKSRSQLKIETRQKKIIEFLTSKEAYSANKGQTVEEIASSINESPSTIRNDLRAMKDLLLVDEHRPWRYYLKRRHS